MIAIAIIRSIGVPSLFVVVGVIVGGILVADLVFVMSSELIMLASVAIDNTINICLISFN